MTGEPGVFRNAERAGPRVRVVAWPSFFFLLQEN